MLGREGVGKLSMSASDNGKKEDAMLDLEGWAGAFCCKRSWALKEISYFIGGLM
jgi:hypothetical protein